MNNNLINQIAMTIFPELNNPPQRMRRFPYLIDTDVLSRVVEFASNRLIEDMANYFHENRLRQFLTDNRDNIIEMVDDLMIDYPDIYQPPQFNQELIEQLLRNAIENEFSQYIDTDAWINNWFQMAH